MSSAEPIAAIAARHGGDRRRLLDMVRDIHARHGWLSPEATAELAGILGIRPVEIRDMASFYHFFTQKPVGRHVVRLCKAVVEKQHGMAAVAAAFEQAAGCRFGETSADGAISLGYTSCLGMSDQPPSAMIDGTVITRIDPAEVPELVRRLRADVRVAARVDEGIVHTGPVIFSPMERGAAIRTAVNLPPEEVINRLNGSKLRGRGGAGFPTAMKWDFCRKANGEAHYVVCNADEGEPGTFKDRVVFARVPDLVFEGMTVAAWAIGAREGILYLRAEYEYLREGLEAVLDRRRRLGLLGSHVCGREGFSFDIRIQMGAGAYVCGEESSLLESAEGRRGAPRDRPPFPVTRGYLGQPTALNNAETLCAAARVLEKGSDWFAGIGTRDSTGTKLLSISGDCARPGVYEVEFGVTVSKLLEMVGASDAQAVQIGGPSGACFAPKDFGRRICFEDVPTGGSVIVFGQNRDLLAVARDFTEFFVEESCGWCAPCRVGATLLLKMLDRVRDGRATKADIAQMEELAATVRATSRCGLGQTAANPFLTTLRSLPGLYEAKLSKRPYEPVLRLDEALAEARRMAGRPGAAAVQQPARGKEVRA
ncbi:MAG: NAD(P)H-dependent oxidoreductase subunit E [Spirochaetes bacterium]|nr:NAD(P)H-dependent oxidoreductase subunit E [Spirochaetota bacterium]